MQLQPAGQPPRTLALHRSHDELKRYNNISALKPHLAMIINESCMAHALLVLIRAERGTAQRCPPAALVQHATLSLQRHRFAHLWGVRPTLLPATAPTPCTVFDYAHSAGCRGKDTTKRCNHQAQCKTTLHQAQCQHQNLGVLLLKSTSAKDHTT